ncbi:glutamate/aspartate transport system substrate-binding protein [Bradyrhizobium sp. GM5.1]
MKSIIIAVIAALAPGLVQPAAAQSQGRLALIRQTGTITLGFPETSLPFAFLDGHQKPIGYTVEICEKAAAEIKASLGLPRLEIRYNPTTSATRIPLLANGTIDLECGNTTNNLERQKLVSFAPTTFVSQVVLMARKDAHVDTNNPASFRGKTIAGQAGGQSFKVLSKLNAEGNYGIDIIQAKDQGEIFLLVETGRAAGAANDDGLAYGQVAASRDPDAFVVGTRGYELAPYGIMEPRGDPEFKAAFDAAVLKLIKDGTVAALYEKYFNAPIPPRGINLKYPMSDALKRALAKPTDSGDPADYQ